MDNQKRIEKLKEKDYQKYFGVNKATFDKMLEILEEADRYKRIKGGRPSVLSVLGWFCSTFAECMRLS